MMQYACEVKFMKLTFLGTAAATALPLPFCNCDICLAAKKTKGKDIRKRSSVVINDDLLIDLGPDSINACYHYNVDLSKIKYILQTHAHSDHFDAGHFITRHPDYATQKINPVVLIASKGTLKAMDKMLKDEDGNADLFSVDFQKKLQVSLKPISYLQTIEMGEYAITALDSLHDTRQESLIFLITYRGKTILYGTDLLEMCEAVYEFLADKLEENDSTIRYWSKVFQPILNIKLSNKMKRYTDDDIDKLKFIKNLIRSDGLTIKQVIEYCSSKGFSDKDGILDVNNPLAVKTFITGLTDEMDKKFIEMQNITIKQQQDLINNLKDIIIANNLSIKDDIIKTVDEVVSDKMDGYFDSLQRELAVTQELNEKMDNLKELMEKRKKESEEQNQHKGLFSGWFNKKK
jgi:phosphoribosyl 1,2-cyclic phosphodiesterase